MARILTWVRMERSDRRAAVEASVLLIGAKIAVKVIPFRKLADWLRRPSGEANPEAEGAEVERLGALLRLCADRLPIHTKCLARALAGKALLGRRGIPTTVVIGVRTNPEGSLEAHAWLRSGGTPIIGEPEQDAYRELASFDQEAAPRGTP